MLTNIPLLSRDYLIGKEKSLNKIFISFVKLLVENLDNGF